MAPGSPGGGWDGASRTAQRILRESGIVESNVEVYNRPGAAGTVGLAEFIGFSGDPHELMYMGDTLIGGIYLNDSAVDLSTITPIARTHTTWKAFAVAADSEVQDLDQLVIAIEDDPRGFAWVGGSAGGSDHVLLGQFYGLVDVDPAELNYVATASGGEAISSVLSGAASAICSSYDELQGQVESGDMRFLAICSDEPLEGVDAATLIESGYDLSYPLWYGILAPPEISEEDRQAVIGLVEEFTNTPEWSEQLQQSGQSAFVLTGDEFSAYLDEEDQRMRSALNDLGLV